MKQNEYEAKLKHFCIRDEFELLERYLYLLNEVRELREYKENQKKRYDNMNKALMTYMDKYGPLDNKKGKKNGVHKQI